MNYHLAARVAAVLLIGLLFGFYLHNDQQKWNRLGRQAYVDQQLATFDSRLAARDSKPMLIFGSLLLSLLTFGLYELLVLALSAILKRFLPRSATGQQGPRAYP